jgi:AraC-like DNA-binding protein
MSTKSGAVKTAKLLDVAVARITGIDGEISAVSNYHVVSFAQTTGEYNSAINSATATRYSLEPDQVVYYPPNTNILINPVTRFDVTSIYIPDHWFETVLSMHLRFGRLALQPFTESDEFLTSAAGLLAAVAFMQLEMPDPVLAETLIVRIAARILQLLARAQATLTPPASSKVPALSEKKLDLIADYVEAHVHRTIRLTEIADLAGMSESHFSRSFRATTGVTPMRFIAGKRVDRAKDLLCHTRKTLAEIAFDCGFASQSHFTTAFKEMMGRTPAAFRSDTWWKAAGFAVLAAPALQLLADLLAA